VSKITESARGEECTIRVPNYCNWNRETTILAHLDGGGMGKKRLDIHAAYSCDACHFVVSNLAKTEYTKEEIYIMHLEGVLRTQEKLIEKGLLTWLAK
jgi:hypothetical protein